MGVSPKGETPSIPLTRRVRQVLFLAKGDQDVIRA